jgi:hypothetical protein
MKYLFLALVTAVALVISACANDANSITGPTTTSIGPSSPAPTPTTTPTPTPSTPSGAVPAWFAAFGNGVQVSASGASIVLQTRDLPDHPSPYWGTGNALYEAPHAGMVLNPNRIATQNVTITVPASPAIAASPSDTPLGAIGVAVNGVVFFNQYAAGRQPLDAEIRTFDRFNGHPQQQGMYHYHVEPTWLTAASKSRLLGVLADGFPVYGLTEAGGGTPANLDVCHGHVGATPEFPSGIYHYHVTAEAPYISGCFRGTAGRIG